MEYTIGTSIEFDVVDVRLDSNTNVFYYLVQSPEGTFHRIYNIMKYQWNNRPSKIFVTPAKISSDGRIFFEQDERRAVKDHYEVGQVYKFVVDDIQDDLHSPGKKYYVISDEFTEHRYYFNSDNQSYLIKDEIQLKVEGYTEKGFIRFKEFVGAIPAVAQPQINHPDVQTLPASDDSEILDVAEGTCVELKTSIVFPAGGNGVADVDGQLKVIVKVLASFMNTKGGRLYIGVHDKSKKILGIETDYSHLNEGSSKYTYKEDKDGYELLVRDTVKYLCNGYANSLIEFTFKEAAGHEYCVIDVKEAMRPIWLNRFELYMRTGNQCTRLGGEDITSFIFEKSSFSILDKVDVDGLIPDKDALDGVVKLALKDFVNEMRPKPTVVNVSPNEVEYYIVWKNDRSWTRQRAMSTDTDVAFQIPVKKSDRDGVLVFCYDNGKVNEVELAKFKSGTRLGDVKPKGFCDKSNLLNIFLAQKSNFIAVYSADENGQSMVKVHHISDVSTTDSPANQGARVIPSVGTVSMYKIISGAYVKIIRPLIHQRNQTSQSFGFPLNSGNSEISTAIKSLNDIQ